MSKKIGYNCIGGNRRQNGTITLHSLDARSSEALPWRLVQATAEGEYSAAAALPSCRGLQPTIRAKLLDAIADELDWPEDAFGMTACRETTLPVVRIHGARGRSAQWAAALVHPRTAHGNLLCARIDRAQPESSPRQRMGWRQCRIGEGRAAVFGASNFPPGCYSQGCDIAEAPVGGQSTATLIGEPADLLAATDLLIPLEEKVGHLLVTSDKTGAEVCKTMDEQFESIRRQP